MKQWKLKRTGDATVAKLFIIIAAVLVVMSFLMPGVFFTVKNFKSMAFQFPEFGIFAIAMALAMHAWKKVVKPRMENASPAPAAGEKASA